LNNLSDDCDSSDEYPSSRFNDIKNPYVLGDKKRSKIADERMEQLGYIMNKKSKSSYQPPVRKESEEEDRNPPYMDRMLSWDLKPTPIENPFLKQVMDKM
jgi:hypothetical protein